MAKTLEWTPDQEHLEAINDFAAAYGRFWRRKLLDFWAGDITQKAVRVSELTRYRLHAIRNTPGGFEFVNKHRPPKKQ